VNDSNKLTPEKFKEVYNSILDRIASNFVEFRADYTGPESNSFFKIYFDIVSQAVFYAFFYAFPKSRMDFGEKYKLFVFNRFSFLFTGLKISTKSSFIEGWSFIEDWCLDLGAGNVLTVY
jgi:Protein of unknown function